MLCGQRVRPPWLLLLLTLVCNGSFPKKKKKKSWAGPHAQASGLAAPSWAVALRGLQGVHRHPQRGIAAHPGHQGHSCMPPSCLPGGHRDHHTHTFYLSYRLPGMAVGMSPMGRLSQTSLPLRSHLLYSSLTISASGGRPSAYRSCGPSCGSPRSPPFTARHWLGGGEG